MIASLPLLATLLFALSPLGARATEIMMYHDNHCSSAGGITVDKKVTSGAGGRDWITPAQDTNSFEVSGAYGKTMCLFMTDVERGCNHRKMQVTYDLACHVLPNGRWRSFWVEQGDCPGDGYQYGDCV